MITIKPEENWAIGLYPMGCYYIYSFAIHPEDLETTGECNFSRIDRPVLRLELNTHYDDISQTVESTNGRTISVYARNYNILSIKNGECKLVY